MRHHVAIAIAMGLLLGSEALAQPREPARLTVTDLEEIDGVVHVEPASPPSQTALEGQRLFVEGRWARAAILSEEVVDGRTGDDRRQQQHAAFRLGVSLFELGLHHTSFQILRDIARDPAHPAFTATLPWLARLAEVIDDAEIVESLARYRRLGHLNVPGTREVYWQLSHLLGQQRYRQGSYHEAIARFSEVAPQSPLYPKSQLWLGITHIRLHRSVPAVKAFRGVVAALDAHPERYEEAARLRDLAHLSLARTFYSAAVVIDEEGVPFHDAAKLRAATTHYDAVDLEGSYGAEVLFERAWLHFVTGDYTRSLGAIHALESPFFDRRDPETEVLRIAMYFGVCRYEDAVSLTAKLQQRYEPLVDRLTSLLRDASDRGGEGMLFRLAGDALRGEPDVAPSIAEVVTKAARDPAIVRQMADDAALGAERAHLGRLWALSGSKLAGEVAQRLAQARSQTRRQIAATLRERLVEARGHLRLQIRTAQKVFMATTPHHCTRPDPRWVRPPETRTLGPVEADAEHVLWPFDGEYWRDELGSYRQSIPSLCGGPP